MKLSLRPATPFADASLPNHTKMFELVHVVTSIDDFAFPPQQPFFRTFNRATFSSYDGESPSLNYLQVSPRFELRLLNSESKVLTITPWNCLKKGFPLIIPFESLAAAEKSVMGEASGIKYQCDSNL
jgi:hypothetical protein